MSAKAEAREKFLADVLVGIVEDGGYNSWRQIMGGTYRYEPPGEAFATIVVIGDGRPEEHAMHDVSPDVIARGLGRLQSGEVECNSELLGWILRANDKNDATNIDAEAADVVLQAAIFGELIYG